MQRSSLSGDPWSAIAATFVASLELVKQGTLELRQGETFGPIYLRQRSGPTEPQQ